MLLANQKEQRNPLKRGGGKEKTLGKEFSIPMLNIGANFAHELYHRATD